jgi:response regulator of citrate/malate metabolism
MSTLTRTNRPFLSPIRAKSRTPRVLIVEDDLALTTVIDQVLYTIDPHIKCDWVTSAEQAAAKIKEMISESSDHPYDLILADIFLEGNKSGLELWEFCRDQFPDMPIVLTSALPVDKFLNSIGENMICPPYLPKPFHLGECRQVLEGMLKYA